MDEYAEFFFPTLDYFVRKAGMEIPVAQYRRYEWPPKFLHQLPWRDPL